MCARDWFFRKKGRGHVRPLFGRLGTVRCSRLAGSLTTDGTWTYSYDAEGNETLQTSGRNRPMLELQFAWIFRDFERYCDAWMSV